MKKDKAILDLNTLLAQNYDQRDQLRKDEEHIQKLLDDNLKQRTKIMELIQQLEGDE